MCIYNNNNEYEQIGLKESGLLHISTVHIALRSLAFNVMADDDETFLTVFERERERE